MSIVYHTPIQLIPDPDPSDPTAVVNVKFLEEHGGKRHAETITGDGTETEWTINHNLDTEDVVVSIWALPVRQQVFADTKVDDADTLTVEFSDAPATGTEYRVVILG